MMNEFDIYLITNLNYYFRKLIMYTIYLESRFLLPSATKPVWSSLFLVRFSAARYPRYNWRTTGEIVD